MKTTIWDITDYIKSKEDAIEAILAEFEQPDTTPQSRAHLIEAIFKAQKRWGWQ